MTPRKQPTWGRVYARGRVFWIRYYAPGPDGRKARRKEPGGVTEAEAAAKLAQRRREVEAAEQGLATFLGPEVARLTVGDILDTYLELAETKKLVSIVALRSHAEAVRRAIGRVRVAAVTRQTIQHLITARRAEEVSDATVDHALRTLKSAWNLAYEDRKIAWPLRIPRLVAFRANAREVVLTPEQTHEVIGRIKSPGFRDALAFFALTGWRPREIGTLEWEQWDRGEGVLRLHPRNAKTRRGRYVPVVGPLVAILARREKARRLDCRAIFHDEGKPIVPAGDKRGFRSGLETEFKVAVREAREADPELWRDVPNRVIPYDLRRGARLALALAGVEESVSMAILGHTGASMHDSYLVTKAMARAIVQTTKGPERGQTARRKGRK